MDKSNTKKKASLVACLVTSYITTFTGSALNLSIPALCEEFQIGEDKAGLIVTGYMTALCVCTIPAGRISDMISRGKILTIGIILFFACAVSGCFSTSFIMLILSRSIQGAGAAMIFATNQAILAEEGGEEKKGRYLGLGNCATCTGMASGPAIGGMINHLLGWRYIFVFIAAAAAIAVIPSFKTWKKGEGNRIKGFDIKGTFFFMLMTGIFMTGISMGMKKLLFLVPAVLLLLLIRGEKKKDSPLLIISLFRNPSYLCQNIAAMISYGSSFAAGYILSIYLQGDRGFTSLAAGLILTAQPVFMAVFSVPAGRLSDRFSSFVIASAGLGVCIPGFFALTFVHETVSVWYIAAAVGIIGAGNALFSAPNTKGVMSMGDDDDSSFTSSVLATARALGHTAAVSFASFYLKEGGSSELFIYFTFFSAAALVFSLVHSKKDPKRRC